MPITQNELGNEDTKKRPATSASLSSTSSDNKKAKANEQTETNHPTSSTDQAAEDTPMLEANKDHPQRVQVTKQQEASQKGPSTKKAKTSTEETDTSSTSNSHKTQTSNPEVPPSKKARTTEITGASVDQALPSTTSIAAGEKTILEDYEEAHDEKTLKTIRGSLNGKTEQQLLELRPALIEKYKEVSEAAQYNQYDGYDEYYKWTIFLTSVLEHLTTRGTTPEEKIKILSDIDETKGITAWFDLIATDILIEFEEKNLNGANQYTTALRITYALGWNIKPALQKLLTGNLKAATTPFNKPNKPIHHLHTEHCEIDSAFDLLSSVILFLPTKDQRQKLIRFKQGCKSIFESLHRLNPLNKLEIDCLQYRIYKKLNAQIEQYSSIAVSSPPASTFAAISIDSPHKDLLSKSINQTLLWRFENPPSTQATASTASTPHESHHCEFSDAVTMFLHLTEYLPESGALFKERGDIRTFEYHNKNQLITFFFEGINHTLAITEALLNKSTEESQAFIQRLRATINQIENEHRKRKGSSPNQQRKKTATTADTSESFSRAIIKTEIESKNKTQIDALIDKAIQSNDKANLEILRDETLDRFTKETNKTDSQQIQGNKEYYTWGLKLLKILDAISNNQHATSEIRIAILERDNITRNALREWFISAAQEIIIEYQAYEMATIKVKDIGPNSFSTALRAIGTFDTKILAEIREKLQTLNLTTQKKAAKKTSPKTPPPPKTSNENQKKHKDNKKASPQQASQDPVLVQTGIDSREHREDHNEQMSQLITNVINTLHLYRSTESFAEDPCSVFKKLEFYKVVASVNDLKSLCEAFRQYHPEKKTLLMYVVSYSPETTNKTASHLGLIERLINLDELELTTETRDGKNAISFALEFGHLDAINYLCGKYGNRKDLFKQEYRDIWENTRHHYEYNHNKYQSQVQNSWERGEDFIDYPRMIFNALYSKPQLPTTQRKRIPQQGLPSVHARRSPTATKTSNQSPTFLRKQQTSPSRSTTTCLAPELMSSLEKFNNKFEEYITCNPENIGNIRDELVALTSPMVSLSRKILRPPIKKIIATEEGKTVIRKFFKAFPYYCLNCFPHQTDIDTNELGNKDKFIETLLSCYTPETLFKQLSQHSENGFDDLLHLLIFRKKAGEMMPSETTTTPKQIKFMTDFLEQASTRQNQEETLENIAHTLWQSICDIAPDKIAIIFAAIDMLSTNDKKATQEQTYNYNQLLGKLSYYLYPHIIKLTIEQLSTIQTHLFANSHIPDKTKQTIKIFFTDLLIQLGLPEYSQLNDSDFPNIKMDLALTDKEEASIPDYITTRPQPHCDPTTVNIVSIDTDINSKSPAKPWADDKQPNAPHRMITQKQYYVLTQKIIPFCADTQQNQDQTGTTAKDFSDGTSYHDSPVVFITDPTDHTAINAAFGSDRSGVGPISQNDPYAWTQTRRMLALHGSLSTGNNYVRITPSHEHERLLTLLTNSHNLNEVLSEFYSLIERNNKEISALINCHNLPYVKSILIASWKANQTPTPCEIIQSDVEVGKETFKNALCSITAMLRDLENNKALSITVFAPSHHAEASKPAGFCIFNMSSIYNELIKLFITDTQEKTMSTPLATQKSSEDHNVDWQGLITATFNPNRALPTESHKTEDLYLQGNLSGSQTSENTYEVEVDVTALECYPNAEAKTPSNILYDKKAKCLTGIPFIKRPGETYIPVPMQDNPTPKNSFNSVMLSIINFMYQAVSLSDQSATTHIKHQIGFDSSSKEQSPIGKNEKGLHEIQIDEMHDKNILNYEQYHQRHRFHDHDWKLYFLAIYLLTKEKTKTNQIIFFEGGYNLDELKLQSETMFRILNAGLLLNQDKELLTILNNSSDNLPQSMRDYVTEQLNTQSTRPSNIDTANLGGTPEPKPSPPSVLDIGSALGLDQPTYQETRGNKRITPPSLEKQHSSGYLSGLLEIQRKHEETLEGLEEPKAEIEKIFIDLTTGENELSLPEIDEVPNRFRSTYDLVLEKNPHYALQSYEKLISDRNFMLLAIKHDINTLHYASDHLKNNYDFMIEAVKVDGTAVQYASNNLKDNHTIVMAAVKNQGEALEFASDRLKADQDIQEAANLSFVLSELTGSFY